MAAITCLWRVMCECSYSLYLGICTYVNCQGSSATQALVLLTNHAVAASTKPMQVPMWHWVSSPGLVCDRSFPTQASMRNKINLRASGAASHLDIGTAHPAGARGAHAVVNTSTPGMAPSAIARARGLGCSWHSGAYAYVHAHAQLAMRIPAIPGNTGSARARPVPASTLWLTRANPRQRPWPRPW